VSDFLMPSLGADMDEGTLVEWLVKPGDEVHKGDVIAVVDTAKAAIEVESFATGTIERLIVDPGQVVPVGTVLATITDRTAGEGVAEHPAAKKRAAKKAAAEPAREKPAPEKPARQKPARERRAAKRRPPERIGGRIKTMPMKPAATEPAGALRTADAPHAETGSPLIRHLAEELGVDLSVVHGTGHGGLITRTDVESAARTARPETATAAVAPEERQRPERPRATPLARRIAAELGVDVAAVTGSGPEGAVREEDVRRAAAAARTGAAVEPAAKTAAAVPTQPVPTQPAPTAAASRAQAMRLVTARLMARSKREIPHYYLSDTIDLSRAMAWLHDRNRELDVTERLVPAALLLKAAAVAARQVPQLNGYWTDDQFRPAESVHLGVAISLRGGGLVTPAIHDAAGLTPLDLMNKLRDLVTRARTGRLRGSELTDATITVTNLGDQGVEMVYGVIYPPQVALVGFGKVAERPVAVDGMVGARPVVMATLAADHRATDGYTGARFLTALSDLLQRPEEM
jgi:pyruvate dehydrogenase E2 component (dihydrolipoyllysine-residue acetyltransferase)